MKKIIVALMLIVGMTTVSAHEGRCCYRNNYGGWVMPTIIGGVIGYELGRPRYEPAPVIVQPAPIYTMPVPPYGYHWQQVIDPTTNTTKWALMPN